MSNYEPAYNTMETDGYLKSRFGGVPRMINAKCALSFYEKRSKSIDSLMTKIRFSNVRTNSLRDATKLIGLNFKFVHQIGRASCRERV